MALINVNVPTIGEPHGQADAKIQDALTKLVGAVNGGLDQTNFAVKPVEAQHVSDSLAKTLGVNNGAVAGRGTQTVAGPITTTSSSFVSNGGPTVTVDSPSAGGMVFVYVEATVAPAAGKWAALAVNGGPFTNVQVIKQSTSGTYGCVPGSDSGVPVGGGGFMLSPASGHNTFEIKFASESGTATFTDVKLWVIGMGT